MDCAAMLRMHIAHNVNDPVNFFLTHTQCQLYCDIALCKYYFIVAKLGPNSKLTPPQDMSGCCRFVITSNVAAMSNSLRPPQDSSSCCWLVIMSNVAMLNSRWTHHATAMVITTSLLLHASIGLFKEHCLRSIYSGCDIPTGCHKAVDAGDGCDKEINRSFTSWRTDRILQALVMTGKSLSCRSPMRFCGRPVTV